MQPLYALFGKRKRGAESEEAEHGPKEKAQQEAGGHDGGQGENVLPDQKVGGWTASLIEPAMKRMKRSQEEEEAEASEEEEEEQEQEEETHTPRTLHSGSREREEEQRERRSRERGGAERGRSRERERQE